MNLVDLSSRTLGQLGDVGPFSFGMWRFTDTDLNRRIELVEAALSAGLNLIDTADVYGLDWNGTGFGTVEIALGEVLQQRPELRERMVLATKGKDMLNAMEVPTLNLAAMGIGEEHYEAIEKVVKESDCQGISVKIEK